MNMYNYTKKERECQKKGDKKTKKKNKKQKYS